MPISGWTPSKFEQQVGGNIAWNDVKKSWQATFSDCEPEGTRHIEEIMEFVDNIIVEWLRPHGLMLTGIKYNDLLNGGTLYLYFLEVEEG